MGLFAESAHKTVGWIRQCPAMGQLEGGVWVQELHQKYFMGSSLVRHISVRPFALYYLTYVNKKGNHSRVNAGPVGHH